MMQFNLDTAIRLPVPDVEALIHGRMITAMPKIFIEQGRVFALCPTDVSTNLLPPEQYYRSNFLPIAQTVITQLNSEKATIKAWAKCELCQMLDKSEQLEVFSGLTIWKTEALEQILSQRPYIFLIHLRVYLLPKPWEIAVNAQGQFTALPSSLSVTDALPVLSDTAFSQRRYQLENRIAPLHPELEELQSAIAQLATTNPAAKQLDRDIQIFLGWNRSQLVKEPKQNLAWIDDIAALGNRSIEEENAKKSNYQAGTDFENITRRSLEFLGFKVDEAYKGGAGGLDLFCSEPYPLVGECKAGKSIPDRTVEELDRIGRRHLKENYLTAFRLIIGPGEPTKNLRESAEVSKISIIKPMTLQKLVELQRKYPGSVNLIELKQYLETGQIDSNIDKYINKVETDIELRAQVVEAVKDILADPNNEKPTANQVRFHYNATFGKISGCKINSDEATHDLLVELSSPLTGYLGREKGSDWQSDHFYYLRDLIVNTEQKQ